jgi:hypothetical protein
VTTGKSTRDLLNDLPKDSPWPPRLLGVDRWEQRTKSKREIEREFEREKWGGMLRHFQEQGSAPTLAAADAWLMGDDPRTTSAEGDYLIELSVQESQSRYRAMIASALAHYLPASAVVELGAGYGSVAIEMARRNELAGAQVYAAELAESGKALIELIASTEKVSVIAGRCDLNTGDVSGFAVPAGSILYTASAACYVPRISPRVIDRLSALNPRAVIHFEPVYEHCDSSTLLGLMRRRYIEINDYNTNLATVVQQSADNGRIRMLEERRSVYGPNPILVASIIAWAPV